MEVWNREELYNDVWEAPLVKLAVKHGVSAVMIGKVCRKLQIPLPGRGYWTKKEFGKPVTRLPLPDVKNLSVVQRIKQIASGPTAPAEQASPKPAPTDPEWLRVVEMESRTLRIDEFVKRHKGVTQSFQHLRGGRTDNRGMLQRRYDEQCLDIRVSRGSLERACTILNAIIRVLEAEGFAVKIEAGKPGTTAEIFGQRVNFCIVEKSRQKSRVEIKATPSWTRYEITYEPTGQLEFRIGDGYKPANVRDSKTEKLEDLLAKCLGLLLREGRSLQIRAEQARLAAIEREKMRQKMLKLAQEIEKEEKKVHELNGWVEAWVRARQMRSFITALEHVWKSEGHDLSPEAPKGQRIVWMKQQADRLDPIAVSPPSILDRKDEVQGWW